jgi:hypothetical protein
MVKSDTQTVIVSGAKLSQLRGDCFTLFAMTKPPNVGGEISSKGGREAMRYLVSLGVLLSLCATGAFAQTNTIQGDYVESRSLNIFN